MTQFHTPKCQSTERKSVLTSAYAAWWGHAARIECSRTRKTGPSVLLPAVDTATRQRPRCLPSDTPATAKKPINYFRFPSNQSIFPRSSQDGSTPSKEVVTNMSILLIVRRKCTLAASNAVLLVSMPMGQTDGQTDWRMPDGCIMLSARLSQCSNSVLCTRCQKLLDKLRAGWREVS